MFKFIPCTLYMHIDRRFVAFNVQVENDGDDLNQLDTTLQFIAVVATSELKLFITFLYCLSEYTQAAACSATAMQIVIIVLIVLVYSPI
jgi:hypothetical protein